jgi:predicted ATPase/DNA-binding SARP family transcriptional activator
MVAKKGITMEAHFKLYLFGAPRMERDGETVEFTSRRALAALAYIALSPHSISRETLATLLWPDASPEKSRARLRRLIYDLNQALGKGVLQSTSDNIGFSPNVNIWVDVKEFKSSADAILGENPEHLVLEKLITKMANAAELAQGDFLGGFSLPDSLEFDDWQFYERENLRRLLDAVLERLVDLYQEAGNYAQAVYWGQKRRALDHLSEPAARQLMTVMAAAGQQSSAVRVYDLLTQSLRELLDIEPEDETTELYESIRKRKFVPAAPQEGEPVKKPRLSAPLTLAPHNLPDRSSSFVGRAAEISQIKQLLTSNGARLVTLTGPGGVGKTRLALQSAYTILLNNEGNNPFKDGIYFISLAPVSTGGGIASAAASEMNLPSFLDGVPVQEQLILSLQGRSILLIFDNFEHLLEDQDSISLLSRILTDAASVKLLVTSRSRVNVLDEQVIQIGGFSIPEESSAFTASDDEFSSYSAVEFFIECARRIQPSFTLTPDFAPHILKICRMVDGLPLAIELAAAWISVLSPSEIAVEIEKSLDFLEADWRDMPERQKSLRVIFETSWQILTKEEQDALRGLSIFSGGFTRQAAEAVCSVDLKILLNLSGKSWLTRQDQGRFQIHNLLRAYAYEKLEEDKTAYKMAWDRYSKYYAQFLSQQGELMKGPNQGEAFKAVKEEFQNIRMAWLDLVEKEAFDSLKRMLYGLVREALPSGRAFEALSLIEAAHKRLQASEKFDPVLSAILQTPRLSAIAGLFLYDSLETPSKDENETLSRVWNEAGSFPSEMGYWYILLTYQYGRSINRLEALQKLTDLLPVLKETGKDWEWSTAKVAVASLLSFIEEYDEAAKHLDTAISFQKSTGDRIQCALSLHLAGSISIRKGNFNRAENFLKESLELVNEAGEASFQLPVLSTLAGLYLKKGEFDMAFHHLELSGQIARQIANPFMEAAAFSTYSYEAVRYGSMERALETRLRSINLFENVKARHYAAWCYWELGELHRVNGDLLEAVRWYKSALPVFEELGISSGQAFYERGLGDLALMTGEHEKALFHFERGYSLAVEILHEWLQAYTLSGMGRAEISLGRQFEAREHLTKAVEIANSLGNFGLMMVALAGTASLNAALGRAEEAALISTFIINHYTTWRETRMQAQEVLEKIYLTHAEMDAQEMEKKAGMLTLSDLLEQVCPEILLPSKSV